MATTPETTSQTEPNNRRNDRRRQARHQLIDGNRRQPERQPAKQPQKTLWRQRIPSLPPQCVSASSNHRIAMADAPGRSVVCHIAIFIAAMAGRRASLHTPRFHRCFPRNRQSPRFPNDAPDHARASHTGIRHQPTRIGRLGSPASLRKGYSRRSTSSSSRYHAPACCASKCSPGSNLTCCNGTHSRTYETIDALLCVVIMRHSREYVIKRVKRLLDAILHKNTSRTRIGICFFRHVIDKHWLEHMHIHARQTTP